MVALPHDFRRVVRVAGGAGIVHAVARVWSVANFLVVDKALPMGANACLGLCQMTAEAVCERVVLGDAPHVKGPQNAEIAGVAPYPHQVATLEVGHRREIARLQSRSAHENVVFPPPAAIKDIQISRSIAH